MILQASAFGGVFTGFGIARDFESGFGRRLMLAAPEPASGSSPATRSRRWSARCSSARCSSRSRCSAGMEVSSDAVQLGGLIGLALLVNVAAPHVVDGDRAALPLDPGRAADADADLPDPLPRARLRPAPLLTSWIHAVASVNPITPIVEAKRNLIAGSWDDVGIAPSPAPRWSTSSSSGRSPGCSGPRRPAASRSPAGPGGQTPARRARGPGDLRSP